jgi:anti-sigma-K factor RskA
VNTQGNDKLREMLAAEYALGTLRGGARRRFERWMRSDDGLRAASLQWSERLAPLIDEIPSRVPPKRVWNAIEERLPGFSSRVATRLPTTVISWWDRLGLWRGMSAAFATIAVIAVGLAIRPAPLPAPPRIVQVQTAPSAVAMLVDPKSGKPIAVVMTSEQANAVSIKVLDTVAIPEGKVLQLWMAPRDADGMLSMGVLPGDARQTPTEVTTGAASIARAKAFGLSLEPAGGSPQPTLVLGLGAVIRIAG